MINRNPTIMITPAIKNTMKYGFNVSIMLLKGICELLSCHFAFITPAQIKLIQKSSNDPFAIQ